MTGFSIPSMKRLCLGMVPGALPHPAFCAALFLGLAGFAQGQSQYVFTDDDPGISAYAVASDGTLTLTKEFQNGFSAVGGFFGANRIQTLNSAGQRCVFASIASSNLIEAISVDTLTETGTASGSPTDNGASNGIGLAVSSNYLYASFADSNTIGTFTVEPGCAITFLADTPVSGLAGGSINGMAIHANMMVTTFTDGTIESFDIATGIPASHRDRKYTTATLLSKDSTYPNSVEITADGRFAIFGDTSSNMVVEVSYIATGTLWPTWFYTSTASISSSNIVLSPDESVLYVVGTQGATVSAAMFNKKTGQLRWGCTSGTIRGQSSNWSYLGGVRTINQTGTGGGVYVAEFGAKSAIAMLTLQTSSMGGCTLTETAQSPFADAISPGLLSISTFPPRAF
jgi:hypothetical protein